ncbi:thioesterase [Parashewanella spongiae]|uniref:Thioesterase n=1 Tax=Parashewanella spongiae TaxID=342950 RepID=A0A3A6TWP7_9GAMM|nr:thioesterase family protein [Parashewanella spongiae]MCL1077124.1 thioesterase family protein [Parashewanella spongiae]RJY18853.1 thioesterase [Parashewanella spongiae]
MNLYFRLFWLLLWQVRRCKRIGFLDTSKIKYRTMPSDCDINFHLTNSRYAAFMDLARTYMMAEMGVLKRLIKLKWMPIVNASEFTYIRDIKPFEIFTIESKIVGWDEKYFYIEQRFITERGLHCIVHVRGVFIAKRQQIPITKVIKTVGFTGKTPTLPPEVIKWISFLNLKKAVNMA